MFAVSRFASPGNHKNARYIAFLFAIMLAVPLATQLRPHITTAPAVPRTPSQGVDFGKLPISFEANEGQTDPSVKYMAHASGGTMYFTPSEVVLALKAVQSNSKNQPSDGKGSVTLASVAMSDEVAPAAAAPASVVRLQFIGASSDAVMSSGEVLPGKVNYFIGNDASKWHSDVPTYASTHYEQLYAGIGLTYEGTGGQLKGTYTVAAGSDPTQIRWRYSGAENVSVDEAGNLQIVVAGANSNKGAQAVTVTEQVPLAWQEIDGTRLQVSAHYVVASDQSIGFVLGSYDHNNPLTIDPTLTYSTYLGGSGGDSGSSIAVDTSGSAYVTGGTNSTNFPLQNPFQPDYGGGIYDTFVTKFSPTGSTLIYSTYLGGSYYDYGYGIAVDASGSAYVTGFTGSFNFPLQNPFQPDYYVNDAFVTKLNPTGSALTYSTFLGGGGTSVGTDRGYGIAVDASGSAYVTGDTSSSNFPLQNPFQPTKGGNSPNYDAFVTKFSPTGTTLVYSTYLGGSGDDRGYGIAVDASGSAYVTGFTGSANFPLQNPFRSTYGGGDAFVTTFNPAGSALTYSTYLVGGSSSEGNNVGRGIAVDTSGSAYVTGDTDSANFPLQNPFQPTRGGTNDAFVTKFSPTGTTLVYSTYLGGRFSEQGYGIAVDASGSAYVTGETNSTNFPLQDPFQPTYGGPTNDAFVTKFSPTGTTLVYSTYLGGSSNETGYGIAVDASGSAYVTGDTFSTNFPLQNPFQPTFGGYLEAFVAKISQQSGGTPTVTPVQPTTTRTPTPSGGTATPSQTGTPCAITFTDVHTTDYFYQAVIYLACHGAISGYSDNTFRPYNNTTRGQVTKIVILGFGIPLDTTGGPHFSDVPTTHPFYAYVETASHNGIVSGYGDGTFRPSANVTRGQLSKIVVVAAMQANGWTLINPPAPTFNDVAPGSAFYQYVETAVSKGVISGYGDRTFRPGNDATRGQIAKITYGAVTTPSVSP